MGTLVVPTCSVQKRERRSSGGHVAGCSVKRAYRVAATAGVSLVALLGVFIGAAHEYHRRRFARCESAMTPLAARQATPPEVGTALGGQRYASYSRAQVEDVVRLATGWGQKVELIRAQAALPLSRPTW